MIFPCLFCNHEKSVTVKLDKKAGVGQLSCKVCNQQFQCAVNCTSHLVLGPFSEHRTWHLCFGCTDLSAAVDVYADWVDACDAVAKEGGGEAAADYAPARPSVAAAGELAARNRSEDNDDDDLDGAEGDDGLDGYGGEGIVADDEDY